jgi:hypothetical protein
MNVQLTFPHWKVVNLALDAHVGNVVESLSGGFTALLLLVTVQVQVLGVRLPLADQVQLTVLNGTQIGVPVVPVGLNINHIVKASAELTLV